MNLLSHIPLLDLFALSAGRNAVISLAEECGRAANNLIDVGSALTYATSRQQAVSNYLPVHLINDGNLDRSLASRIRWADRNLETVLRLAGSAPREIADYRQGAVNSSSPNIPLLEKIRRTAQVDTKQATDLVGRPFDAASILSAADTMLQAGISLSNAKRELERASESYFETPLWRRQIAYSVLGVGIMVFVGHLILG